MASYEYVVTYWPTSLNVPAFRAARDSGEDLQVSFETLGEAVAHAQGLAWWPFIVERVKRG